MTEIVKYDTLQEIVQALEWQPAQAITPISLHAIEFARVQFRLDVPETQSAITVLEHEQWNVVLLHRNAAGTNGAAVCEVRGRLRPLANRVPDAAVAIAPPGSNMRYDMIRLPLQAPLQPVDTHPSVEFYNSTFNWAARCTVLLQQLYDKGVRMPYEIDRHLTLEFGVSKLSHDAHVYLLEGQWLTSEKAVRERLPALTDDWRDLFSCQSEFESGLHYHQLPPDSEPHVMRWFSDAKTTPVQMYLEYAPYNK